VAVVGQLLDNPAAGEEEIREALSGVLCGCGSYPAVVEETLRRRAGKRKYVRR